MKENAEADASLARSLFISVLHEIFCCPLVPNDRRAFCVHRTHTHVHTELYFITLFAMACLLKDHNQKRNH